MQLVINVDRDDVDGMLLASADNGMQQRGRIETTTECDEKTCRLRATSLELGEPRKQRP